jgi:hypothetical protein
MGRSVIDIWVAKRYDGNLQPMKMGCHIGHYFDVFLLQPVQRFHCIMDRCQIGPINCFVIGATLWIRRFWADISSFFVYNIVFFQNSKNCKCVMLFFLTPSRDNASMRFLMLCNTFHTTHGQPFSHGKPYFETADIYLKFSTILFGICVVVWVIFLLATNYVPWDRVIDPSGALPGLSRTSSVEFQPWRWMGSLS